MAKFALLLSALLCATSTLAFTQTARTRQTSVAALFATKPKDAVRVDSSGNNLAVKSFLENAQQKGLLSQLAQSGLLSKAQAAGVSLSSLEPFLKQAAKNPEILILVEASGPEILPLLPQVAQVAPSALPLLAAAVAIPPFLLNFAGFGAIVTATAAVYLIPDNNIANIALQTFIIALSLPAAAAAFVGASVLGELTKKTKTPKK